MTKTSAQQSAARRFGHSAIHHSRASSIATSAA
jgi:hypothetical protein